jgi:histidinol-phosphate aminotransferase
VTESLTKKQVFDHQVKEILDERDALKLKLQDIAGVKKVYPTDANFILVKINNAKSIYQKLIEKGIVVRDRSNIKLCDDCLRITVGTKEENKVLIKTLEEVSD